MSIETLLTNLIAAVEANTAAVLGKSGGTAKSTAANDEGEKPATTRRRSSGKSEGEGDGEKAAKSKYTAEHVKAAAVKVKDELGTKTAKQLIKDHGADELAALKPENYEAFIEACNAALNGEEGGSKGDDDL